MTSKRLFGIMFIFVMTAVAWMFLGYSLSDRSSVNESAAAKVAARSAGAAR